MKRVSVTYARSHFDELLEEVTTLGRIEIVEHGRVVGVLMSPGAAPNNQEEEAWTRTHMIPPALARASHVLEDSMDFDDDWA